MVWVCFNMIFLPFVITYYLSIVNSFSAIIVLETVINCYRLTVFEISVYISMYCCVARGFEIYFINTYCYL